MTGINTWIPTLRSGARSTSRGNGERRIPHGPVDICLLTGLRDAPALRPGFFLTRKGLHSTTRESEP
jgi:hypothetical protein